MYFGDYLVSQKVITNEQLVLSLIFQIESLPSIYQIIFDEKLVQAEMFLEFLKNEAKDGKLDLIGQLKSRKIITEDKIQEYYLKQISKKIPLGEVICRLNFSTPDTINFHLKNFYDNKFHEIQDKEDKKVEATAEVEISAAALESLKELGMDINSQKVEQKVPANPFVDQFLELFTEKFKNKVLKLLQIMKKSVDENADVTNYINSLYRDVHLIKGSVMLAELKLVEDFISLLDEKIEKQLINDTTKLNAWFKVSHSVLDQSINALWTYTQNLSQSKNDQTIQANDEMVQLIQNLNEELSNL